MPTVKEVDDEYQRVKDVNTKTTQDIDRINEVIVKKIVEPLADQGRLIGRGEKRYQQREQGRYCINHRDRD